MHTVREARPCAGPALIGNRLALLMTALATLVFGSCPSWASPVTYLGSFRAEAVNSAGRVVGWLSTSPEHAAVWEHGTFSRLPELSGTRSRALDVNDAGTVVGYIDTPAGAQAAVWTSSGASVLPAPHGTAAARTVSDTGFVGGSYFDAGYERPVIWSGGVPTELPTLGGVQSDVSGINAAGVAVGWSTRPDNSQQAVMWVGGELIELGGLGSVFSTATAINDAGSVVGYYIPTAQLGDPFHAFLWSNGQVTDLGASFAAQFSAAEDINASGQIVGRIGQEAVLWEHGATRFLNAELGTGTALSNAVGISNAGDIAFSTASGGAVLLVPEPSSLALWLAAFVVGGLVYRRRA